MEQYGLGEFLPRLHDHQAKIIPAVRQTGKQGELTIKIKWKPSGQKGIVVTASFTPKPPVKGIPDVEMFVTEDNKLTENDPDQMRLDDVIDFKKKESANGQ